MKRRRSIFQTIASWFTRKPPMYVLHVLPTGWRIVNPNRDRKSSLPMGYHSAETTDNAENQPADAMQQQSALIDRVREAALAAVMHAIENDLESKMRYNGHLCREWTVVDKEKGISFQFAIGKINYVTVV